MLKKIDKNFLILAAGLILGLGLGFLVLTGMQIGVTDRLSTNKPGGDQEAAPATGAKAPDFELKGMDGENVRLSSVLGQPVLINFWATWCGPCQAEMPLVQKTSLAHASDLVILAINDDEPEDVVRGFILDNRITFKILLDPGEKVMAAYRVNGLPTSFFIDREGVIRFVRIGILDEQFLGQSLKQIGVSK